MKRALLSFVLAGAAASACGDSRNSCSTKFSDPPKLSEIQREIFDRSCAFTSCHGANDTQPKGAPLLLTAGKSRTSLVTVSQQKPSVQRVQPGSPGGSYLIEKLTKDMPTAGNREPQGSDPLCQPEIDSISRWIAVGAMDN